MNEDLMPSQIPSLENLARQAVATGLAQCAELVWQLREEAGVHQVEGARLALQHNIGIGGSAVKLP